MVPAFITFSYAFIDAYMGRTLRFRFGADVKTRFVNTPTQLLLSFGTIVYLLRQFFLGVT